MSLPTTLNLISELIAKPSVSSVKPEFDQSNREVIDLLANWCGHLGFHCDIMPVPQHTGKFNLIATLGHGAGGLVLSGHTDTVPYDLERWQTDPFKLVEHDQKLYGLGTTDMKSFFALVLSVVEELKPQNLRQPLILLATADEESSMHGARALVKAGLPKARHAIIGEPTGLRPIRMHKGAFMEAIHLQGLAGHSSDPSLGNSALEGMHLVIGELLRWRAELQAEYQNPLFHVPYPTLNLGHIHGGDNPNRICGACELHIDLRPLPGMNIATLRQTLHQRVTQAVAQQGLQVSFTSLFDGIPAVETAAQADIVRIAEQLTDHQAEAVAFATEAPYLKQLGIDTVILGPGDIDQAHQPDEFIALDRLQPMMNVLRQMIQHFCM